MSKQTQGVAHSLRDAEECKRFESSFGPIQQHPVVSTRSELPDGRAVPDVYFVVYEVPGGLPDGSFGAPNDMIDVEYQVTSVGPKSRKQARAAADLARRTIIQRVDRPRDGTGDGYAVPWPSGPTPTYSVVGRVMASQGGTDPSGTEQAHPFTVAERFTVRISTS